MKRFFIITMISFLILSLLPFAIAEDEDSLMHQGMVISPAVTIIGYVLSVNRLTVNMYTGQRMLLTTSMPVPTLCSTTTRMADQDIMWILTVPVLRRNICHLQADSLGPRSMMSNMRD